MSIQIEKQYFIECDECDDTIIINEKTIKKCKETLKKFGWTFKGKKSYCTQCSKKR